MAKNLRSINPSEHQIQSAIVDWSRNINWHCHNLGNLLIAIPNGEYRHISSAKRLKKEGVKSGVSDMFLAIPHKKGIPHGLWIEVKTKIGKISFNQKRWMERMNRFGYSTCVVRTVDEGIQKIKDYLGIL